MRLTSGIIYFYPYLVIRFIKKKTPKACAIMRHTAACAIHVRGPFLLAELQKKIYEDFDLNKSNIYGQCNSLDHLLL